MWQEVVVFILLNYSIIVCQEMYLHMICYLQLWFNDFGNLSIVMMVKLTIEFVNKIEGRDTWNR